MSDKSLFYRGFEGNTEIEDFFERFQEYAEANETGNSVYILKRPLGDKKYTYDYDKAVVILVPKHKMLFLDYGGNEEAFEEYVDDFVDDVGHISDKYDYMQVLGRTSKWRKDFIETRTYSDIKDLSVEDLLKSIRIVSNEMSRKGEFIISLLTGSINDIEKTGIAYPETILEKIKRKIVLFDGEQTRFIYDEPHEKRITIQGLAGTGKTELLLHKIKEIYTHNDEVKIAFTCHNKILADNLRTRIPEFFNFMKVQEQIKWEEKLWVMSSWGPKADRNSGVYSYICDFYGIPFERFTYSTTFEGVCKRAIANLREQGSIEPCFDYILIDESQDFAESFFKLCEMVTRKCVYVAGDIFQNVFDYEDVSRVEPQFLLNKCYRTDPKTLMCAHAIGMGLFKPDIPLRWLSDSGWSDCGYDIKKNDGYYDLYRKPLRRFEDLGDVKLSTLEVMPTKRERYFEKIIEIIAKIQKENETVEPEDIGIMFLENNNTNYELAKRLQIEIKKEFGWNVNIGYETKEKIKDTLFVSNKNNVKGLEFPFVICFMQGCLTDNLQTRNSIYMMLTRSFITSYFILPDEGIKNIEHIMQGVDQVNKNGYLHVKEPTDDQKKTLYNAIIQHTSIHQSQREIVEDVLDELRIPKNEREKFHKLIETFYKDEFDKDRVYEIVQTNYNMMNSK